jgi:nucleotide-binding universal stress UspA family protein
MDFIGEKILCATDGSKSAQKAIDYAVELVKQIPGAEVYFVNASRAETTPEEARYLGAVVVEAADAQDYIELRYAHKSAGKAGISKYKCVRIPAHRNTAAAIIHYAETEKFDHIIMGSTGRTGVSRMLMGSVASEVVAKAHCPVTIVR